MFLVLRVQVKRRHDCKENHFLKAYCRLLKVDPTYQLARAY